MEFEKRYKALNTQQREAVDHIDGPLMVVAGPGTGKTELLGMRAANILKKTDTLPQNILCLTFTESGADAMRRRLSDIIGQDAYKVAIHTFHSFGSEIINQNSDYFYQGADFHPASDLNVYEILRGIFEELDHVNPLASTMNGEFTHLSDTIRVISELKKSGLTSDELLQVLDDNERVLDTCESELATVFSRRISKTTADELVPIAHSIASLKLGTLPPQINSLVDTLALSISHAVDSARLADSTKPITAWRNKWLEKNDQDAFVFKDRKRTKKLRAVSFIYYQYLMRMQEKELYDFDDMVLRVVHALEVFDDLRYNLQEKYLYIMVDEFQDTNLAQSRLLRSLANSPASEGAPNIMVVGDDDQAIYSFQGAEISNILQFKDLYETTRVITLTDNYRSTDKILHAARDVITQGEDRLENYLPELDKTLKAHYENQGSKVNFTSFHTASDERDSLARSIRESIDAGVAASSIAVLARKHQELLDLLPYLTRHNLSVNYERRDNVLESDIIIQLELLAQIVHALATSDFLSANSLLPNLLAHPAWGIEPSKLWKLSLKASKERISWLEIMSDNPDFADFHTWLIGLASLSLITPLEPMLDKLTGAPHVDTSDFSSPLYSYFFGNQKQNDTPEAYLEYLEALRTIRTKLREHASSDKPKLVDFLEFIRLHKELSSVITSTRSPSAEMSSHIHLMTAHKSKGLEFEHVYIYGSIDSTWGERVRSRSRSINYPENLPLAPSGNTYDERLRLFFVAMTRARSNLHVSYSLTSDNGSPTLVASFLSEKASTLLPEKASSVDARIEQIQTSWHQPLTELPRGDMKTLLASTLEKYKLSATHLGTFLDITRGGPEAFLLGSLLRFPQAMSPNAAYGSAVHRTLQRAHSHLVSTGKRRPVEDLLIDFEANLADFQLSEGDFNLYHKRGVDYLQQFLSHEYENFTTTQLPELNFSYQQSRVGDARLTGTLDVVDIDQEAKSITVVDYKTGKPSLSWKGKADFEKIKLHKYRQQLMFYKLLVEHSADYSPYTVDRSYLQFVEPTESGTIVSLEIDWDKDELTRFSRLIEAVWQKIITLDLPDTSKYPENHKGILAFEDDIISSLDD
ncbi:MAG TPA: ATP-dependent DNA helicase [Candidatus Saccharimonadales bacterium]